MMGGLIRWGLIGLMGWGLLSGLARPRAGEAEATPFSTPAPAAAAGADLAPMATYRIYLPLISRGVCDPIPGVSYSTFPVINPVSFNVADNPDYNLLLLGYVPVNEYKGLVHYDGGIDPNAPQFRFLFADHRIPVFRDVYKNNGWDWSQHRRLPPPPGWPPVSVAGFAVTPGEVIHLPDSGYYISIENGFQALVLYADADQITLKYTGEDSTVQGYTLYITGICVEPSLLRLYQEWNARGRTQLPALRGGQPLGRAKGAQIDVGIRDNNAFMDPRSDKDWWRR